MLFWLTKYHIINPVDIHLKCNVRLWEHEKESYAIYFPRTFQLRNCELLHVLKNSLCQSLSKKVEIVPTLSPGTSRNLFIGKESKGVHKDFYFNLNNLLSYWKFFTCKKKKRKCYINKYFIWQPQVKFSRFLSPFEWMKKGGTRHEMSSSNTTVQWLCPLVYPAMMSSLFSYLRIMSLKAFPALEG